jgi:hypothetical protein
VTKTLVTLTAAVALGLCLAPAAPAQTAVSINPATGMAYTQHYYPYTYGSTAYYSYPNTGYTHAYNYLNTTISPAPRYGPGYTVYSRFAYDYYRGAYYRYPGLVTYRTIR